MTMYPIDIDLINRQKIILGSASSRRQELLHSAGINFDIVIKDYVENYPSNLEGEQVAIAISQQKAEAYKPIDDEDSLLITADTIVLCNNEIMGKPANSTEAFSMLRKLSAKTHKVITGITLTDVVGSRSFSESTFVTFCPMSDAIINHYIDHYKPFDKAGAYGIQEWIGEVACSRIEGSYLNVVGLPLQRLLEELTSFIYRK